MRSTTFQKTPDVWTSDFQPDKFDEFDLQSGENIKPLLYVSDNFPEKQPPDTLDARTLT